MQGRHVEDHQDPPGGTTVDDTEELSVNEEQSVQGDPKRSPWIAFAIISSAVMAMVVAFFIAENQRTPEQDQEGQGQEQERLTRLQRGTSCLALSQAETALESDDGEAFALSIIEARQRAEHALDTSGVLFGAPERHAMFLAEDLRRRENARIDARMRDRLEAAVEACERAASS